jgi:hypothetical protein
MDGSVFELRWGKDFIGPALPQLPVQWVSGVSGGGVKWHGRVVENPPHLTPRSKKE